MQTVKSISGLAPFLSYRFVIKAKEPSFIFERFSFCSSLANSSTSSNPALYHYLIETLKFSETQALNVSNRFSHVKSIETPESVLQFFQNLGFSSSHIQTAVRLTPQILFARIDRCLNPKIKVFQDLGLVGYDLGKFISKNPLVLTASLKTRLVPRIEMLKKILLDDKNNEGLIKAINRCYWILCRCPDSRLLSNIALLESCGIVGSQLAMLLRRQPRLFVTEESKVRDLISQTSNIGFSVNSRMFVYGLCTVIGISDETFERKFGVLKSFGFSQDECTKMFIKAPNLLRCSEKKLKLGTNFFMNTVKIEKEVLVRNPQSLLLSIEERVIPRYKVLEIIKSRRLLKKEPLFLNVCHHTEDEFVRKFILRFPDEVEDLLVAYKSHALDSSSEEENT
ncbi:transcription termination factor MTERF5, chloroplastic-like isoform X2 [Euphorbia lathyris]